MATWINSERPFIICQHLKNSTKRPQKWFGGLKEQKKNGKDQ
jgi:hypothetical protein